MNAIKQVSSLLQKAAPQIQQCRNTVVVKRLYPIHKYDPDKPMKRRHRVYMLDEYEAKPRKLPPMQVLLMRDIQGIGRKGELVEVPKKQARNDLLTTGLAVYASPENIEKYHTPQDETTGPKQTQTGDKTVRALATLHLPIPMHPTNPWTLSKVHVKVAFRKTGIILTEDNIEMPPDPITEPGDLNLKVTVNGLDTVNVKATVYHYYKNPLQAPGGANFKVPKVWGPSKMEIADIAKLMLENHPDDDSQETMESHTEAEER